MLDLMAADPKIATRWRFTVDQYEQMGRAGILTEDDRTELLDGEIYTMSPIGPRHAGVVDAITERLYAQALGRVTIRVQNPLRLPPRSEPQPDIVVARRRRDYYAAAHPSAKDTLLVIEVADTALATDRAIKLPIYARQGIVEVWIVDLTAEKVHIHSDPADGAYRVTRTLGPDDTLVPTAVADVRVPVSEILL
jgi:Uma2 family endonuclease